MQALQLIQIGSVQSADALSRRLGCVIRLSDAVLLHRTVPSLQAASKASPSQGPAVLPDALPGELDLIILATCTCIGCRVFTPAYQNHNLQSLSRAKSCLSLG